MHSQNKMQLFSHFLLFFTLLFISNSSVVFSNDLNVVSTVITVDRNGGGNFKTIQEAVDFIPSGNQNWIKIQISPGLYIEKVTIPRDKSYVFLEGVQGREKTIVTFDAHDRTDTSATFSSFADNVVAKGISFKNSYNHAWLTSSIDNVIKQALAARIYGDKSAFIECGFLGFQDTLWDATGLHYFSNCHFEGAVDFIFGGAQSYYEDSSINVTVATQPLALGFITAQGRASFNDPGGFVFKGGSVFGSGQALLGRAYGAYSRVIFQDMDLGSVVAPQGWDAWSYKGQEPKLTYTEIKCKGLGYNTSKRVPWEKKPGDILQILDKFSRSYFIDKDGRIARITQ